MNAALLALTVLLTQAGDAPSAPPSPKPETGKPAAKPAGSETAAPERKPAPPREPSIPAAAPVPKPAVPPVAPAPAAHPVVPPPPAAAAPPAPAEQTEEEVEEEGPVVSGELKALLAQKQGTEHIVTAQGRAYFEALPSPLKRALSRVVESEMVTTTTQLQTIFALELSTQKLEVLLTDNCVLCHSDPDSHGEETLFGVDGAHTLTEYVNDAHFRRGLSCAGCHGGDPASTEMDHEFVWMWPEEDRQERRRWVVKFCARCHSEPKFMRGFAPAMATDQAAKYEQSGHGVALLKKRNKKAAQCISCHGTHGIRGADSPQSMVHPQKLPETCGSCHSDASIMDGAKLAGGQPMPINQTAEFVTSVHGKALLEKNDLGAPACNDCHGNHAALPPAVAAVAQVCRTCHAQNGALFDGSTHKKQFDKHGWPECGACHGNHAIAKTSDAMLGPGEDSMCEQCHAEHAQQNPECNATAKHFYSTLTHLAGVSKDYAATAEDLAHAGLDPEPVEQSLEVLNESLTQARSYIHAFERNRFDAQLKPGTAALEVIAKHVAVSRKEYSFRRIGLMVSIGLLGMVALLLYLKLRHMERRQRS